MPKTQVSLLTSSVSIRHTEKELVILTSKIECETFNNNVLREADRPFSVGGLS